MNPNSVNQNIAGPPLAKQRSGVIAVLFLFVIAFIFGAISLSMQTGQIIERRIISDQAADNAVFALASKSAQGLNFISANNLAIAGASHMAGAMHLIADWIILIKLIASADCFQMGQFDASEYDSIYKWFRPIAKVYFRSAYGMSSLNSYIAATFPIVGLVDAVSVGAANSPGSVIIPFGTGGASNNNSNNAANTGIMTRLKDAVKDLIHNISPKYAGLQKINSDETFCLAYKTGKLAIGDWEKVNGWLTGDMVPSNTVPQAASTFLHGIVGLMSAMTEIIGGVEVLGRFVRFRVGFSACGFGDTGDFVGGGPKDGRPIADLLKIILTGPISGRVAELSPPNSCPSDQTCVIHASQGDQTTLETQVNSVTADQCQNVQPKGQWKSIRGLEEKKELTPRPTGQFICTYLEKKEDRGLAKKYVINSPAFQTGTPAPADEKLADPFQYLWDYKVACPGTVLFKWSGYSGLQFDIERDASGIPIKDGKLLPKPAPESHPSIDHTDIDSDLCPKFVANDPRGGIERIYNAEIGLKRREPVVHEILEHLHYDASKQDEVPDLLPGQPFEGSSEEIISYLNCAQGVKNACPQPDGSFEDIDGHKFFPRLDKLNWLCPIDDADPNKSIIRQTLSFHAGYLSSLDKIQEWHNKRIDQFITAMHCDEYRAYDKAHPKPTHAAPIPIETGPRASSDYCGSNQHMCWQRNLQKLVGNKLKEGHLSFTVPMPASNQSSQTPLEASLEYGVMTLYPLRIDNSRDIIGRNDGSVLAHCPSNMDVKVQLENGGEVQVCDVQPVIGMISNMIKDDQGHDQALDANESLGFGNANLASGGGIEVGNSGAVGLSGFMAISQAGVSFVKAPDDPTLFDPASPSLAKTYQLFWPSWRPKVLPSRIMSRMLPSAVAPLVED